MQDGQWTVVGGVMRRDGVEARPTSAMVKVIRS
jgi:hypothetical protein